MYRKSDSGGKEPPSRWNSRLIPVQTDQIHIRMQTAPVHVRVTGLMALMVFNFHVTDTLWLTNILLFFSALKINKLKIWRRQILSRFLVEPNKFCQSSASGSLEYKLYIQLYGTALLGKLETLPIQSPAIE